MQSPRFCWELPATVDNPKSPLQDDFAPWFALQDPHACSEKDRALMTNHFVEHLVKKSTQCWPGQPATAARTLHADPNIQEQMNKWLHAWQWSEPVAFYTSLFRDNFLHPRSSDWVEASLRESADTTFALQLALVLESEYLRGSFTHSQHWGILCRTGYIGSPLSMDAPSGAFLKDFLAHWEKRHDEKDLLACAAVLELLHPRPTPGDSTDAEEETLNAVYQGFLAHRRNAIFREPSTCLPSDLLEGP